MRRKNRRRKAQEIYKSNKPEQTKATLTQLMNQFTEEMEAIGDDKEFLQCQPKLKEIFDKINDENSNVSLARYHSLYDLFNDIDNKRSISGSMKIISQMKSELEEKYKISDNKFSAPLSVSIFRLRDLFKSYITTNHVLSALSFPKKLESFSPSEIEKDVQLNSLEIICSALESILENINIYKNYSYCDKEDFIEIQHIINDYSESLNGQKISYNN